MSGSGAAGNLFQRLNEAMESTDFGWSLCLVGEDQTDKMSELTKGLRGNLDTGDGKQISSGFSYWGIGPTIAWSSACNDVFYPVMKESLQNFKANWRRVLRTMDSDRLHYVSLGVGTGDKDRAILEDMHTRFPDMIYLPVDMSSEMLRLGGEGHRQHRASRSHHPGATRHLRGGEPRRAQAPAQKPAGRRADPVRAAGQYAGQLRRRPEAAADAIGPAAAAGPVPARTRDDPVGGGQGTGSRRGVCQQQVLPRVRDQCALAQHRSDSGHGIGRLPRVGGGRQPGAAREIRYHNQTGERIRLALPNREVINFDSGQSIRVYLTRKYSAEGIAQLVERCGLVKQFTTEPRSEDRSRVGVDLFLLTDDPHASRNSDSTDIGNQIGSPRKRR